MTMTATTTKPTMSMTRLLRNATTSDRMNFFRSDQLNRVERVTGIEPALPAWEADTLKGHHRSSDAVFGATWGLCDLPMTYPIRLRSRDGRIGTTFPPIVSSSSARAISVWRLVVACW